MRDLLPTELWIRIFELLSFEDLQNIRFVCKRWNSITNLTRSKKNVIRLTPSNCSDILTRLNESPLVLQNRMHNLLLMGMRNSVQLEVVLRKASNWIESLTLIDSPIYQSLPKRMDHLYELSLADMPHECESSVLANFNLKYFPAIKSLLLGSNLATNLRLHLLQELSVPGSLQFDIEHLRLQFNDDEIAVVLKVLHGCAPTLRYLELDYLSNYQLREVSWKFLFQKFTKLEALHLNGGYSNDWLYSCFVGLSLVPPNLELDLSGCVNLEDRTLNFVFHKWRNSLDKLNLMFCSRITDASICLLNLQSNLKVLDLSHCHSLMGHGIVNGIATGNNFQLRELFLNGIKELDGECFRLLVQRLPNLEHLAVCGCTNALTDHTLPYIFGCLTELKSLELDDCSRLSDKGFKDHSIQQLKHLRKLSLRGCYQVSDLTLCNALKSDKLRILYLDYCRKITSGGIKVLVQNCPLLKELSLSSCSMIDDEAVLHAFKGLKMLRLLNLSNCNRLTTSVVEIIVKHCKGFLKVSIFGIDSLNGDEVRQELAKISNSRIELEI